jgi:hypothetical protein
VPVIRRRSIVAAGFGLLLVLGVVACGSSSKSSGSSPTTAASTNQNVAADKTAAQAASLKLSDFPAGWTSQPASNNIASPAGLGSQLATCLGVSAAQLTHAPASYDSPDFSDSSNHSVSSNIGYRATAAEQDSSFALFSSSKLPGCLATALNTVIDNEIKHPSNPSDALPAGATIGKATVSRLSFPQIGDRSTAYQAAIPISYKGLNVKSLVDEVFVIKGRASVDLSFEAAGSAVPTNQQQHYTQLVVNRLTNT